MYESPVAPRGLGVLVRALAIRSRGFTGIRRPALPIVMGLLLGWAGPAFAAGPVILDRIEPLYPHGEEGEAEVTLEVTVSASGEVVGVEALAGREPFVQAAVEAAHEIEFEPATEKGEPVEGSVRVTFHFDPPIEPHPFDDDVDYEIVVEARRPSSEDTHSRTEIDGEALERTAGQDFAESISQVSGVIVGRGTADSSKPIIRGQYERRLLVLFDGVRHESQKWGKDHASEIDPFAAGQISVIKGAAGVRYGPDAIGGVVLIQPPPLRVDPGVNGKVQLVGESNGRRGVGAARLDVAPAAVPGLAVRAEGNFSRGAALSTPDHVLGNTGSQQWNLGAKAQYLRDRTTLTVAAHHYDLQAGICYCVRNGTIEDFLGQLDQDKPVGSENWGVSYAIDRPKQTVTHDLALARAIVAFPGGGSFQGTYAFQNNHRQEYGQVRGAITGSQFDFILRTHSLDLGYKHGSIELGSVGSLSGGLGLSGSFQENVYSGLPLIPNFRSMSGGIYAYERLSTDRVDLELGGRVDGQSRTSYLTDASFQRHLARGTLQEDSCDRLDNAVSCKRAFKAASVSAGALWHVVSDRVDLKLDLSSANRFPNGDELYMNGSAPTSPVYALGDPSLGVETTWGASTTVGWRQRWLESEASVYANRIDHYIYFAPSIGPDGQPQFDVTVRGAYPRFDFSPRNVVFYGFDGGLSFGPDWPLGLKVQGSVVRAQERRTADPLLFVPPGRVRVAAVARPNGLGPFNKNFAEVSATRVARQNHVVQGADLAPPPDGYLLVAASVGVEMLLRGGKTLTVGVEGSNLLNSRYRDYTSLLRYFANEPGRSLRARVGLDF